MADGYAHAVSSWQDRGVTGARFTAAGRCRMAPGAAGTVSRDVRAVSDLDYETTRWTDRTVAGFIQDRSTGLEVPDPKASIRRAHRLTVGAAGPVESVGCHNHWPGRAAPVRRVARRGSGRRTEPGACALI